MRAPSPAEHKRVQGEGREKQGRKESLRQGTRQSVASHGTYTPRPQADPNWALKPDDENHSQSKRAFLTLKCKARIFFFFFLAREKNLCILLLIEHIYQDKMILLKTRGNY